MSEVQERYIHLVKEITQLQWVRESLPSHSKYYEGLKKKLLKQIGLKEFSEKELKNHQLEVSKSNNSKATTTNNLIESVKFYENAIAQLQTQIDQAKTMLDELREEKKKLDELCDELNLLFEQIIIPDPEDSTYVFEQHLKRDVIQLANDIPDITNKIMEYTLAQNKLYEARELIETAMKSLPGASTFMDRQAIVANQMNNNQSASSFFGKSALVAFSSSIVDPIKNADKIAQQSYQLVKEASEICPDVPQIPSTSLQKGETNVVYILTTYRGYRLKIEYTLRTQVNPRLHGFENQLAMTKYHYEQRVIEWINHQILSLESYLRANGCLANENLEREISMLRMGSRAALAAVASETSGRVTVDDVLEISSASEHAILPEYEEHNRISMDESSTTTTSSSPRDGDHNMTFNTSTTVHDSCEPNIMDLPSYYPTSNSEQIDLPPPAYSR